MVYQGSKSKYTNEIVPILPMDKTNNFKAIEKLGKYKLTNS